MVAIQIEMLVLDGPFKDDWKCLGRMLMKEDLLSNTDLRDLYTSLAL